MLRDRREIKIDRRLTRMRIRGGGRPTRKGRTEDVGHFFWCVIHGLENGFGSQKPAFSTKSNVGPPKISKKKVQMKKKNHLAFSMLKLQLQLKLKLGRLT